MHESIIRKLQTSVSTGSLPASALLKVKNGTHIALSSKVILPEKIGFRCHTRLDGQKQCNLFFVFARQLE